MTPSMNINYYRNTVKIPHPVPKTPYYLLGWLHLYIPLTPTSQQYLTYIHYFDPIDSYPLLKPYKPYPLIGYHMIINKI